MFTSRLLKELERHPVLQGVVPDRQRLTHAEVRALPPGHRHRPGVMAIRAVPSWQRAEELVAQLGSRGYQPAVPVLARLWLTCPVIPVMTAAGHALFQIGTAEAHAALQGTLGEGEHLATFLAIKSIVKTQGAKAFDLLAPWLREDSAEPEITTAILGLFGAWSVGPGGRQFHLAEAVDLLRQDPRWVELAVRLRRHGTLGDPARHLLATLDRDEVEAALRRWPDPPVPTPPLYRGTRDFAARYRRGEHEAVWGTLFALGPITDADLREEVAAVARLTMARVRANVEQITRRLRAAGYPFDLDPPWANPSPDVQAQIRQLEDGAGGPVPISLRAFWETVGAVYWKYAEDDDQVVDPPWGAEMSLAEADPLWVDSPETALGCLGEWQERRAEQHPEVVGPLTVDLAPDQLHKANISGGPPYGITVPNAAADAVLENEAHGLPFVAYLRWCFRWGGFPLLEQLPLDPRGQAFLDELRRDLEPF